MGEDKTGSATSQRGREASNAVVTQRIEVTPGLVILRVVPDGWELPDFTAGQFGVLGLLGSATRCVGAEEDEKPRDPDKLVKRAYSIASSSVAQEYMEFYVALVPSGALTPRLFCLEAGSRVWLSERARGMFTLDQVPEDKHVVFIGTGTGLAPYMSMMRTHLVCGGSRRFAVLHGARRSWDLGYRSELMTLRRMCDNFTYIPSISRKSEEAVEWMGESGYVQDVWASGVVEKAWGFKPGPEDTHVFLCGNPSMVDAMAEALDRDGFVEHSARQPGQLHVERYW